MRSTALFSLHSCPEFAPALQAVLALLPFFRSCHRGTYSLLLAFDTYVPHDSHSYILLTAIVAEQQGKTDIRVPVYVTRRGGAVTEDV